jgi:phosphatidylglycerophosphate synthase
MTLYKGRERFSGLSVKVGIAFSKLGLSPNQWTVISLVPALIAVYFLIRQDYLFTALFFLLAVFIDLVDGSVARVTGRVTRLGAYLDTIIDRYVEGIIIAGLFFVPFPQLNIPYLPIQLPMQLWLFTYFFGALTTTYAKAAAKEKNIFKEKELRGGLLERPERLIILLLGFVLAHFDVFYLSVIIVLLAFLTNLSAIHRILIAYRESRKEPNI